MTTTQTPVPLGRGNIHEAQSGCRRRALTPTICTVVVIVAGVFGAGAVTHSNSASAAQPSSIGTSVTSHQRLAALGFTATAAKSLLSQMEGLGRNQRYAAERIAMAVEWGGANAFGTGHSPCRNRSTKGEV
jgi:hypothetical protein